MNELAESVGRVGLAALLGACLGVERELAHKPAGLRTHILVAVSAATLMLLGDAVVARFAHEQAAVRVSADPLRVIQAIVIGISFLGGGTIVQAGGQVEGLTTAASILVTAAVGLAAAAGQAVFAAFVTAAVLAVLFGLGRLETWLGPAPSSEPEPGGEEGRPERSG